MKHIADRHKAIPAVYVIFRDNDKMLLSQRFNTGYRDGEWSLPGGHVGGANETGGEPAIMAAAREAKEEVGVDIKANDLQLVHTMHRLSNDPEAHERIDLCFEATRWDGELTNAEPEKYSQIAWFNLHALPKNIVPEVRDLLEQSLIRHQPYSSFGFD